MRARPGLTLVVIAVDPWGWGAHSPLVVFPRAGLWHLKGVFGANHRRGAGLSRATLPRYWKARGGRGPQKQYHGHAEEEAYRTGHGDQMGTVD